MNILRKLKDFYEAEGSTYVSTERLPVGCSLEKNYFILCLENHRKYIKRWVTVSTFLLKCCKMHRNVLKVCGPDGYHAVVQPNPEKPEEGFCSDL